MRYILYILCILCISSAIALTPQQEIKKFANQYDNGYELSAAIDQYLNFPKNNKYGYTDKIADVWRYKKYDCTGRAALKCHAMKQIKVKCQVIHGLADGQMHDWVEWQEDKYSPWMTDEYE